MSLRIYNSMTREKEPFAPAARDEVGVYVCGVTPYELAHVGHARSALVFDVIRRYLRFRGYQVRFVRNYTDVDDKIIARAARTGEPTEAVAERFIEAERRDMGRLGIEPPDIEPRATQHIAHMVALVERLVAVGVAYPVDGDVYFEVRRFPAYGRLSGKDLDALRAGARVEVDERKRDPLDFALWKAAKPGEPSWPSPWGAGRPGWHIECSAMSMHYLGSSFDIHGGGQDLVFPHHENEIAQSEAATGRALARYWVHNGLVNLGAEKMSKSLGNVMTLEDLLKRYDRDAVRLGLLGTHYRHPLDFGPDRIDEAARALARFQGLFEAVDVAAPTNAPGGMPEAVASVVGEAERRFRDAMDDDFNAPQALAVLFELARALHTVRAEAGVSAATIGVAALRQLGQVLGLFAGTEPGGPPAELRAEIEQLVGVRADARRRRAWAEADAVRARLASLGVTVEDSPTGTTWKWRAGTTPS